MSIIKEIIVLYTLNGIHIPYGNTMRNPNVNSLKALALGLVTVFLAVSLSGCIQTELGKALLFREEERSVVYATSDILTSLSYVYKDNRVSTAYDDQENFEVKEGAKWAAITIEVTIQVIYPPSIIEHFIDMNEVRYVKVFIVDPDEKVYIYEFSSSAIVNLDPFVNPTPGLWKVSVSAMGRGVTLLTGEQYNDGYRISGSINQPT